MTKSQSPEVTILRELLTAGDDFVSGSLLAERLSVSRVAVWSHMEKLRALGFDFDARPRIGYRLKQTPPGLSPVFIEAFLSREWNDLSLYFHESIDSTNSEAERLLANGSSTPFTVVARSQTKGRGRLGRKWFSADSGNLYLSFAFQPRLPPQQMQTFTLWMGVAICDFLSRQQNLPLQIKWPNDLLLDGKKLGGMLTEARIDNDRIRDLVFGLGLNVNGRPEKFPPDLRPSATSLAAGGGPPICLNRFTAALMIRVLEGYRDFTLEKQKPAFLDLWHKYDALFGKSVTTRQGDQQLHGTARGIDEDGHLLLEQSDGSILRLNSGDVTLTRMNPASQA